MDSVKAEITREKDGGPVINWLALKLYIIALKLEGLTEPYLPSVTFSPVKDPESGSKTP